MNPPANIGAQRVRMPGDKNKGACNPPVESQESAMTIKTVLDMVDSKFEIEKQEPNWNKLPKSIREFIKPAAGPAQASKKTAQGPDTSDQKKNILHELARGDSDFGERRASFTKWLVTRAPYSSLLSLNATDYSNTPFHLALQVKNDRFVEIVLDNCKQDTLAGILRPKNSKLNSKNCLHLAIETSCKFTQRIIEKCKAYASDVFQQGDREETKDTPLHLAVMKLDASEDQKEIVELLISVSNKALLQQNSTGDMPYHALLQPNSTGDMPYQARIKKLRGAAAEDLSPQATDIVPPIEGDYGDVEKNAEENAEENATVSSQISGDSSDEEDSVDGDETENRDTAEDGDDEEASDSDVDEEEAKDTLLENVSRVEDETGLTEEDEDLTIEEDAVFRETVIKDPILKIIRSYCIRNFERSDVALALYHGTQERETYFNLSGRSDLSITSTYLEKLARHLKFESVLSYVALPKLSVLALGGAGPSGAVDTESKSKGRRDMETIFDWLRKEKVETIYAVTVIDSLEPSHSDAAIESALRGFKVEIWDWKKLDLNCDVIAACTEGAVREISLYSSGNNAVLMGWSSEDGLRCKKKFPKLKHIHLYYDEGLEDDARLEQYIDTFARKMRDHQNEAGENIEVTPTKDDKNNSYMDGFRVRGGARSSSQWGNRWLDSMRQFLQIIFNIPPREAGYVKIAVIDNGVDASLDALDGKIAVGTSFCPIPDTSYHNPYYMTSETISHGSMVAGLICRMCPKAKLYVARIDELPSSGGGHPLLTAESAAKAILWAAKKNVDVICMSWTIEHNQGQNDTAIDDLNKAIEEAKGAGIIMLCSASDHGSDFKESYPGSTRSCIRIGAGTENGDKCSWVHKDDFDYCFPGENVPLKTSKDGPVKIYNGSSVATAVAAGSVGLLLYLNKLSAKGRKMSVENKKGNDLTDVVRKALESMCKTSKSTNSRCPRFGDTFGKDFNEFMFMLDRDTFYRNLGQIIDGLKK